MATEEGIPIEEERINILIEMYNSGLISAQSILDELEKCMELPPEILDLKVFRKKLKLKTPYNRFEIMDLDE